MEEFGGLRYQKKLLTYNKKNKSMINKFKKKDNIKAIGKLLIKNE